MKNKNIISNFKSGDEIKIEKIIDEYSNYLYTVIKNISGSLLSEEDIEEIILDVFLALWQNQRKLDISKNIKPYISSIAHNLTKKKMSKKINMEEIDENLLYCDEDLKNSFLQKDINSIISKLSKEEYKIFTEFYYYSKRTNEIAKDLGISNINVKTKLHRIRKKIRKELKEMGYGL